MEIIIIILFVAVVVLLYLFVSLKNKEKALKQEFDLCKSEHKLALSELEKRMNFEVTNQAGAHFQQWRDKECETIRLQQVDIAKREAATHFDKWKGDAEKQLESMLSTGANRLFSVKLQSISFPIYLNLITIRKMFVSLATRLI